MANQGCEAVAGASEAERAEARAAFLDQHGWADAAHTPIGSDASFRSYVRVRRGDVRAVLMDAPPGREDVRPFLEVAAHLRRLGLSAPRVLATEVGRGFALIEDLGDDTYARLLDSGEPAEPLYQLAVDTLLAMQTHPAATDINVPTYDEAFLLREAALLPDWYLPARRGQAADDAARQDYLAAWQEVLGTLAPAPRTLVLRDFHVDNLMLLPDRPGIAACGVLDFQTAVIGHAAYDLASLLEDARRDVPAELARRMLARYLAAAPWRDDAEQFLAAYAVLGAQRHCKVAGLFVRLAVRDGKPGYDRHLPRVIGLLERRLAQPALAPLRAWLDCHVPNRHEPLAPVDAPRLRHLLKEARPGLFP